MYIYYIIFCFHSENQCPTTHPHIELSIPMVVVTPGYAGMPTLRQSLQCCDKLCNAATSSAMLRLALQCCDKLLQSCPESSLQCCDKLCNDDTGMPGIDATSAIL